MTKALEKSRAHWKAGTANDFEDLDELPRKDSKRRQKDEEAER